jgi:hypothetical protein
LRLDDFFPALLPFFLTLSQSVYQIIFAFVNATDERIGINDFAHDAGDIIGGLGGGVGVDTGLVKNRQQFYG